MGSVRFGLFETITATTQSITPTSYSVPVYIGSTSLQSMLATNLSETSSEPRLNADMFGATLHSHARETRCLYILYRDAFRKAVQKSLYKHAVALFFNLFRNIYKHTEILLFKLQKSLYKCTVTLFLTCPEISLQTYSDPCLKPVQRSLQTNSDPRLKLVQRFHYKHTVVLFLNQSMDLSTNTQ
ncbi:hypothetical protein RRG08_026601 [Elysia crispata]|uniref:Uncharacterized protein n=1 Tax=Elysia crispata TaxID=231223 RepID=A0AAE1DKX4_9GAST|nr:hypothetical protein RRG08_026601 [Elysia crispata]